MRLHALKQMHPPSPQTALRELVRWLPSHPPAAAVALIANAMLGDVLNSKTLPHARGRVIAIDVLDLGLRLRFLVAEAGLIACGSREPDAVIRASAGDFAALARRAADPDTLFFSRRLTLEGDTELALSVKNTLDGIDFHALRRPSPFRVFSSAITQLSAFLRGDSERHVR